MPCILAIEQASIDQLNPNRLKKTIDFGNSVYVLVRVIKEDTETVGRLLRLGCMGFVTERASASVVDQALRALAKREIWVDAHVLADFVRSLLTSDGPRAASAVLEKSRTSYAAFSVIRHERELMLTFTLKNLHVEP